MSETSSYGGDEEDGFEPLEEMPTMRLNDLVKTLAKPSTSVVNLDALLPIKDQELILQTLFYKIQPAVKCLSLRFNTLNPISVELVIDWIAHNNFIEILYTMGCGFDEKTRKRLEDAWRKNMTGHRLDNMGYTFIRVTHSVAQEHLKLEESKTKK
jgi:hypothetical protein